MAITLYIAGHTGLVGSALVRRFTGRADVQMVTATRTEVDLTDARQIEPFLARTRPHQVIIAAGRVGGILANRTAPAAFIYDNLAIATTLIRGAWKAGVKCLLNFGSSCMYPKHSPQPMRPEFLMTGQLEPTSEPYAIAKWAGWSLCTAHNRQYGTQYVTAIPCTLYGPRDNFDATEAHVLAALLRKFHQAKECGERVVTLWGSGQARRELLYVDDLAEACDVLLARYTGEAPINIGSGHAYTIRELAELVADIVGFQGEIRWDMSKPDGAPEKRLDASVIHELGWVARTPLRDGVARTYQWFLEHDTKLAGKVACASL